MHHRWGTSPAHHQTWLLRAHMVPLERVAMAMLLLVRSSVVLLVVAPAWPMLSLLWRTTAQFGVNCCAVPTRFYYAEHASRFCPLADCLPQVNLRAHDMALAGGPTAVELTAGAAVAVDPRLAAFWAEGRERRPSTPPRPSVVPMRMPRGVCDAGEDAGR